MPSPENVLTSASRIQSEVIHPTLGIPMRFRASPLIDPLVIPTDEIVRANLTLVSDILPGFEGRLLDARNGDQIYKNIFVGNQILQGSLDALESASLPLSIDTCQLQLGTYAFHYLHRVETTEGYKYMVSYVSRFPKDHILGFVAEADYEYLSSLYELFGKQNKNVRDRFQVVRPLAYGEMKLEGKQYGVYTTEFVPKGELHVAYNPIVGFQSGSQFAVPVFYYAVPLDKRMIKVNGQLRQNTDALKDRIHKNPYGLLPKYASLAEYQAIKRQQLEVLKANAVLYWVTEGMILGSQAINAGDWMVTFNGLAIQDFTLMTTRGKMKQGSPDDWVKAMMEMTEKDKNNGTLIPFKPFMHITREEMLTVLQEAKVLVDRD